MTSLMSVLDLIANFEKLSHIALMFSIFYFEQVNVGWVSPTSTIFNHFANHFHRGCFKLVMP